MLTLDEAINHCEEKAIKLGFEAATSGDIDCLEYAEEYRQLAEWLKELKVYKETPQGDLISRSALLKAFAESNHIKETVCGLDVMEMLAIKEIIDNAPNQQFVQEIEELKRPQGEWLKTWDIDEFTCDKCRSLIKQPTLMGQPSYNFCPNCGTKMDMRGENDGFNG